MKHLIYFFSFLWLCTSISFAQSINGSVYNINEDGKKEAVIGASVYWNKTTIGTTTDIKGNFSLERIGGNGSLIISFIGFTSDTVKVTSNTNNLEIELKREVSLNTIELTERKQGSNISTLEIMNMEKLSTTEFQKAACCNLSESFETNATVDVNFSDAVSGAKKIQMLGLDGVYTQILFENLPYLRGLSAARGLSYIPGTWLESISITKGSGSVVNGYESMTGQINLEIHKPEQIPPFYVNIYGNQMGRLEANVHLAREFNEKWSSALFLHGSDLSQKNDNNNDGFLDMPLKQQLNLMNRWRYKGDRYRAQVGFRILNDENTGGQLDFKNTGALSEQGLYGVGINSNEAEVFFKNGLIFPSAPNRSIALIGSARRSEQDYFFGIREYYGVQNTAYLNLIYQSSFISDDHIFKLGSSYMLDEFDERFVDSTFSRNEKVPGVYGEYTYTTPKENFSFNFGLRSDFHNLYGTFISPRLHVKFNPHPLTSFRISGGKGFRTANVYAENSFALASSRRVTVLETLNPEVSWNAGINVTHKFKLFDKRSYINLDYFRTEFENQVIVDLEDPQALVFYNLDGQSFSNSVQLDFGMTLSKSWDMKMAGKLYDVKATYGGDLKEKPLVKNLGGLLNIGFVSRNEKWRWDGTGVVYGSSRIPGVENIPEEYRPEPRSDAYFTVNSQITRRLKTWEFYLGCENITNYKQPNAILAADDPFGSNFDASLIWGPIAGRTIYGGIKYYINHKNH